jgi:hypothetical protein
VNWSSDLLAPEKADLSGFDEREDGVYGSSELLAPEKADPSDLDERENGARADLDQGLGLSMCALNAWIVSPLGVSLRTHAPAVPVSCSAQSTSRPARIASRAQIPPSPSSIASCNGGDSPSSAVTWVIRDSSSPTARATSA